MRAAMKNKTTCVEGYVVLYTGHPYGVCFRRTERGSIGNVLDAFFYEQGPNGDRRREGEKLFP
jgi:hypothetical protein